MVFIYYSFRGGGASIMPCLSCVFVRFSQDFCIQRLIFGESMKQNHHLTQIAIHAQNPIIYIALCFCVFCLNACDDIKSGLSSLTPTHTDFTPKNIKIEFEKQIAHKLEIMLPLLENGTPIPPSVAKCIAKDRASKFTDLEIAFIMESNFGEQEIGTHLDKDSLNKLYSKLNSLENLISFPPHCYENLVK